MDDRLRKFAYLVDIGGYTKAALRMHISQPALTIAINKLEQELGVVLLVRNNRKLEMTAAGQITYRAAQAHKHVGDDLVESLARLAGKKPSLRLGMIDSVAAALCSTAAFDQLDETARVTVVVNNSRYLVASLERGELDSIYVVDDGQDHVGLTKQVMEPEVLLMVCHKNIATVAQGNLDSGKLDNFISYDKPSTTYKLVRATLLKAGIRPHISLFSTSPDVILQMLLRGKGTAMLPTSLVKSHLDSGELIQLKHCGQSLVGERPLCNLLQRGSSKEIVGILADLHL